MGFVRRADGCVVYAGGHVGSRGSLTDVKYGGGANLNPYTEDERVWVKKVFGSANMYDYAEEDFLDDYELDLASRIFGVYEKKYETPSFDGCFQPANR